LNWPSDYAAFGGPSGLTFANKVPAFRAESFAALVAVETIVVPFATNCGDHQVVEDRLFAACALRRGSARVALQTPSEAVSFHKWSVGVKRLHMNVS
jgi:hypothetical protein